MKETKSNKNVDSIHQVNNNNQKVVNLKNANDNLKNKKIMTF